MRSYMTARLNISALFLFRRFYVNYRNQSHPAFETKVVSESKGSVYAPTGVSWLAVTTTSGAEAVLPLTLWGLSDDTLFDVEELVDNSTAAYDLKEKFKERVATASAAITNQLNAQLRGADKDSDLRAIRFKIAHQFVGSELIAHIEYDMPDSVTRALKHSSSYNGAARSNGVQAQYNSSKFVMHYNGLSRGNGYSDGIYANVTYGVDVPETPAIDMVPLLLRGVRIGASNARYKGGMDD